MDLLIPSLVLKGMDWVIVNYYRTGETFTVIESECLQKRSIKRTFLKYLPVIIGILRYL